jgi:hypothetical protein
MQRALFSLLFALGCSSGSGDDGDPDSGQNRPDARPGEDTGPKDVGPDHDAGPPFDGGPGYDGGTEDFERLTDDFESGALDNKWRVHRSDVADVRVENGQLAITMNQEALWFQNDESVLVYQEVTGDFAVEGAVYARKTSSPGTAPDRMVHLGGIMARNGESPSENYVFAVVGYDENDLSVETKSTLNGVSDYVGPTWPSGDAELRVCRSGSTFRFYKRAIGASTWELAATQNRPDLPARLQVGANAYAFGQPDLTVRFDAVRFAADCP